MKNCPSGTATSKENCPTIANYTVSGVNSSTQSGWTGNNKCYTCNYACNETNTFASQATCQLGSTYTCTKVEANGVSCYVRNSSSISATTERTQNAGTLNLTTSGSEDLIVLNGSTVIQNTTNKLTGEAGKINISHNSTGSVYAMKGTSSNRLTNEAGASINIQNNSTGSAYGMYAANGGTAFNRGTIKIEGETGTAYGIYGEGANTIENSGTIDVSGRDAYGIYVKDGDNSHVFNTISGIINVNAEGEAHGIYIDQNSQNAVVENQGKIIVNGEVKEGQSGITLNGAKLKNAGKMVFSSRANLNSLGGNVYLEKGGSVEATALSGDMYAGTSTVMGNNADTYVETSALKAEDLADLNVISESAMFDAIIEQNQDKGTANIKQERKNFSEFTPNASIANYLEENYQKGYLTDTFDDIKRETTTSGASKKTAKKLGYDVLPNFADENFTILKSLNRNMADKILAPTDAENRVETGGDHISWETDGKGLLSGADLSSNSMYMFGDKRLNNNNRLGLGLSYTKLSSDYDTGGDRDMNIISIFVPYIHKFAERLHLASIFSLGYGHGEYDRGSNNESKTNTFFYGITNELRYTVDLNGFAELEPALMLNAIGYLDEGYDEGHGAEALETKGTHNLSVEAGFGLYLKKAVKMEKYGKLGFKIGGAYYRELGTPYDNISARMKKGANNWYRINDYANLYSHDRAILEAAIDYEYKKVGIYLKYNRLLQKNNPELFDLGVKYNF